MAVINRSSIYDKNLNFLIGSGASVGLLPTLSLKIKNTKTGSRHTIETLATEFEGDSDIMFLIFSYYVENIIGPAATFDISKANSKQINVLKNYIKFLTTILQLLHKKSQARRVNIFTTNYDGLLAHCAERMIKRGLHDFVMNDGGIGFVKRTLQTRSFSRHLKDQGAFDQHEVSIPQINLIQPHGSIYWYKDGEGIEISYALERSIARISAVETWMDSDFEDLIQNESASDDDIDVNDFDIDKDIKDAFWKEYKTLPVVNPNKWKFNETVFEEHYYQSLRYLSYELEKPNSVLIVFGFSFADEHILSLVKRSLSNPTLQMFLCCYSDKVAADMKAKFRGYANVEFITTDSPLDFTVFNEEIFSIAGDESGTIL